MRYNASKRVFQNTKKTLTYDGTYVRSNDLVIGVRINADFFICLNIYGFRWRERDALHNLIGKMYTFHAYGLEVLDQKSVNALLNEMPKAYADLAKEHKKDLAENRNSSKEDQAWVVKYYQKELSRMSEQYMALAMVAAHYNNIGAK